MRAIETIGHSESPPAQPTRLIWTALIIVSGVILSAYFACITPFAALATLAALKLGRAEAIALMGLVWVTNQAIGYGLLSYPWTWDSMAWGLAIAVATGLATFAARALSTTRPAPFAVSLPFVAAFAIFELSLYAAGFVLPASEEAFSLPVIRDLFLINSAAMFILMAVNQLCARGRATKAAVRQPAI